PGGAAEHGRLDVHPSAARRVPARRKGALVRGPRAVGVAGDRQRIGSQEGARAADPGSGRAVKAGASAVVAAILLDVNGYSSRGYFRRFGRIFSRAALNTSRGILR